MKATIRQKLAASKRHIQRRLDKTQLGDLDQPMFTARNIHYEIAERARGLAYGGIGAMHLLATKIGLVDAINRQVHVLKIHLPFHESDHVLNIAYNALCNGDCLDDIELRRNDAVFLDALGAQRIPDPTTAGDFCRRFDAASIERLQAAFDEVRVRLWYKQPEAFFDRAIIDADGTLVPTWGACKGGMDIAYDGTWGFHPLLVSLANTGEVLRLINRSGNRPSHEGAADSLDQAITLCLNAGFRQVLLRGDTDFSQTKHLDRWNANRRVRFLFGFDSLPNLQALAESLPERAWQKLVRPPRYEPTSGVRQRPDRVKDDIVRQRAFETLKLDGEEVAEFNYRPTACREEYRMIVVRKHITKEKGEVRLYDEIRYFFYITNDWVQNAAALVLGPNGANGRCHQENLIAQLKNGVHALKAPVNNLESNWAYMVMTALAWNLKAWTALMLPETGRWAEKYRAEKQWLLAIEFKTFVNAIMAIPCQIVRQARRIVYRVLNYNPHQAIFFRLLDVLRC